MLSQTARDLAGRGVGVAGTGQPDTHPSPPPVPIRFNGMGVTAGRCCVARRCCWHLGGDQITPSIQGGWEHVQRGTQELRTSTSCSEGGGREVERVGRGRQCELGGPLFAVLVLATVRGHPVFLSASLSVPSFWKHHSAFPLRNYPASTPSPWHLGRVTLLFEP